MLPLVVLALLVTSALGYWLACDPAAAFPDLQDEERVVVFGRVGEVVCSQDENQQSLYEIEDPTGRIWCISKQGASATGAFLVVWGKKGTTDSGRPICRERRRIGSY